MFTVHIVKQSGTDNSPKAVASRQAGGCTSDELPRENARLARATAAKTYGGNPTDWEVLRYVGQWENHEAAEIIAQAEMEAIATAGGNSCGMAQQQKDPNRYVIVYQDRDGDKWVCHWPGDTEVMFLTQDQAITDAMGFQDRDPKHSYTVLHETEVETNGVSWKPSTKPLDDETDQAPSP